MSSLLSRIVAARVKFNPEMLLKPWDHGTYISLTVKKIITMVLYNRPKYTAAVLYALSRCDGVEDYLILVRIEPGNEEVIALAKSITFAEVQVNVNAHRFGIGLNTYKAWESGFEESEFIIHIEDDTVPAPDCLRYMEYCRQEYQHDPEIFSVGSYDRQPCPPEQFYEIGRRSAYTCWLVGVWRDRWSWAKDHWSPSSERYATHLTSEVTKRGLKEVYPKLSRCQNIGADGGVHVPSAEWHRLNQHTEYWAGELDLKPGPYYERPLPLITAIMVTGMDSNLYRTAKIALECFRRQIYQNTELLIINCGSMSLFNGDRRIRECRVVRDARHTIADLRNIGLQIARGQSVISWDDASWHSPDRIEVQAKSQHDGDAILLRKQIRLNLVNGSVVCELSSDGFIDTMLNTTNISCDSYTKPRGRPIDRFVLDNDPFLYITLETANPTAILPQLTLNQCAHINCTEEQKKTLEKIIKWYSTIVAEDATYETIKASSK